MGGFGDSVHFRWVVLGIVCFGMLGYSYCYDNVVALQDELQSTYNLSNIQYNLLYSVYAFPNCFLPFVGGVLLDKIGTDIVVLAFFVLIVIGHGLFIFGCIISYYPLMIVGRFLFGAGCESYAMAISPLIFEYFQGKEVSFALGLTLSLSRIGSSINDVTTFYFYKKTDSIIFAISVGFILILFCLSLLLLFVCYRFRHKNNKKLEEIGNDEPTKHPSNDHSVKIDKVNRNNHQPLLYDDEKDTEETANLSNYHSLGYFNDNEGLNDSIMSLPQKRTMDDGNTKLIKDNDDNNDKDDNNDNNDDEEEENNEFRLSDLKHFDAVYWILLINCGLIYSCITPWMNIGADYLRTTFGYTRATSNQLLMVPYICGGIFTPFFGYLSDKIGKRTQLLLISTFCLIFSHYILGWSDTKYVYEVMIALGGLGMAFSLFCAVIWPSFALVVKPRYLGTAFGIPSSFYNAMVAVAYVLVGVFTKDNDDKDKYKNVEYFLMIMSIVSIFTVCLLIIMDRKRGKRLNKPTQASK